MATIDRGMRDQLRLGTETAVGMRAKPHELPDCFAVWYNAILKSHDVMIDADQICEQGWADWKLDGINEEEAERARKR